MKTSIAGFVGMVLIQANTVPSMLGAGLPPLAMTVQSIAALLLLYGHARYNRITLYVYGNGLGLLGQLYILHLTLKGI